MFQWPESADTGGFAGYGSSLAEVLRAGGKNGEAAGVLAEALDRYERKKNLTMARRVSALLEGDRAAVV